MSQPDIIVEEASDAPFYTPAQTPPAGSAVKDGNPLPKLFQPIKIRGLELHNRIFLAPLCQYSAKNGFVTHWHMAHLGGIISRGPGLAFVEGTAITSDGRITPQDAGIWSDAHIDKWRQICDFAHSQGQKIGIQLAHAGRKASMVTPWLGTHIATENAGGWPVVLGPSPVSWDHKHITPKELSIVEIRELVIAFADAAKRSVAAGFDVVEIHSAHGYLLHSFLSPISNKRTDEYGGAFENRIRFTLEVVDAVRAVIPATMPLFLRISACDLVTETLPDQPSWRVEDTVQLAPVLSAHGVDFLDVSSGGSSPSESFKGFNKPGYQAHFASTVKNSLEVGDKLVIGCVGGISTGKVAEQILDAGHADVVLCGRWFQKNPGLVWSFAEELGVKLNMAIQMEWPFYGRGSRGASSDIPPMDA